MKGDFSRFTFDPEKRYSRVLMQQGRVQLDADWNEQLDIAAHRDRQVVADAFGVEGGPLGSSAFVVSADGARLEIGTDDGAPGRYYVDGLLCEMETAFEVGAQPYLRDGAAPDAPGNYLVYLDVFEWHVSALEDPEIREPALGGPDTTTRLRTTWQVRLHWLPPDETGEVPCGWGWPDSLSQHRSNLLRARAREPEVTQDPCLVPASAGYRRLSNQLYRVEIHKGSDAVGGATFKWSRDNAIVVARVTKYKRGSGEASLTVSTTGRDDALGFAGGDWLELCESARTLAGERGILLRIDKVDGNVLTIDPASGEGISDEAALESDVADPTQRWTVRRWDPTDPAPSGSTVDAAVEYAVAAAHGGWFELEDGVEIQLDGTDRLRTGDYWLIPARTHVGDVLWPTELADPMDPESPRTPLPQAPHGVHHRYARLAIAHWSGSEWSQVVDLRRTFPAAIDSTRLGYVGGDGQEAMPGAALPGPLEVSVMQGLTPLVGADVVFTLEGGTSSGNATLLSGTTPVDSPHIAQTDPDGVARVGLQLSDDPADWARVVTAQYVPREGCPHPAKIHFNAHQSIARQVAYRTDRDWSRMGPASTVQEALDTLRDQVWLGYESGDGQEAMPGETLPRPLRVRVTRWEDPVSDVRVRFAIEVATGSTPEETGELRSGSATGPSLEVQTDADGIAAVAWTLGTLEPSQRVVASLLNDPGGTPRQTTVAFNANHSVADRVHFPIPACEGNEDIDGWDTVRGLLDAGLDPDRSHVEHVLHTLLCRLHAGHVPYRVPATPGDPIPLSSVTEVRTALDALLQRVGAGGGGLADVIERLADVLAQRFDDRAEQCRVMQRAPTDGENSLLDATLGMVLDSARALYALLLALFDFDDPELRARLPVAVDGFLPEDVLLGDQASIRLLDLVHGEGFARFRSRIDERGELLRDLGDRFENLLVVTLEEELERLAVADAVRRLARDHGRPGGAWNGPAARRHLIQTIFRPLTGTTDLDHASMRRLKRVLMEIAAALWSKLVEWLLCRERPGYDPIDGSDGVRHWLHDAGDDLSRALERALRGDGLARAMDPVLRGDLDAVRMVGASVPYPHGVTWVRSTNDASGRTHFQRFDHAAVFGALSEAGVARAEVLPEADLDVVVQSATVYITDFDTRRSSLLALVESPYGNGVVKAFWHMPSLAGTSGEVVMFGNAPNPNPQPPIAGMTSGGYSYADPATAIIRGKPDDAPAFVSYGQLSSTGSSALAVYLMPHASPTFVTAGASVLGENPAALLAFNLSRRSTSSGDALVVLGERKDGTGAILVLVSPSPRGPVVPWWSGAALELHSAWLVPEGHRAVGGAHDQLVLNDEQNGRFTFVDFATLMTEPPQIDPLVPLVLPEDHAYYPGQVTQVSGGSDGPWIAVVGPAGDRVELYEAYTGTSPPLARMLSMGATSTGLRRSPDYMRGVTAETKGLLLGVVGLGGDGESGGSALEFQISSQLTQSERR